MKKQLLVFILFISSLGFGQQNVWVGTVDDKWSNKDNWSGEVPSASEDILIPSGFTVTIDTPADILSIEVQGNSVLNITRVLRIANPSEFEDNVVVNWSGGDLNGGGILLNSGTINMSFPSFDISESTTLNNPGTINLIGGGTIFINTNSVLNNSGTGIIDFKSNGVSITKAGGAPNVLNNYGIIKTSFPNNTDEGFIASQLINHDGNFQIESGILNVNFTTNLMAGQFDIFTGTSLNLNSVTTISGTLTGNVFGDLNWNDDFIVQSTAVFDFNGNKIINCTGNLEGGGTLTNLTTINQQGGSALQIDGATILDNEGTIQITNGPGISIGTNSVLNNNNAAVIDIREDGAEISALGSSPNIINNLGLIKLSFLNQTDESIFRAQLNNNNGVIQIDNGILWLFNTNTTLTNGTYNVAANGTLKWTLPITVSGSLNGVLDGILGWEGDLLVPTTTSFNFTGNGSVEWSTQSLNGGGILTNEHIITTVSGSNKIIDGATTLINNGKIISSSGFVRIGTNSTLNNALSGTINIVTEAVNSSFGTVDSAPHTFINSGTLIASATSPAFKTLISAPINNFGTIEATSTEIEFSNILINETSGVIKGGGIIDLPAARDFTNNGTFAPGNSPGSLTIIGDYSTSPSSILGSELDGLAQVTDYDLLSVQGNASFNGDIEIVLGFEPSVNDEFIVATTTGSISNCSFPSTKTVDYNGFSYEFSIACRNNDEVVLTVTNKVLGLADLEKELSSVKLYPNPTNDITSFSEILIIKTEVFNINGRKVLSSEANSISTKTLSKGIYIIKGTTSENISITKKLVKN